MTEVSYDTGDAGIQWRLQLYATANDRILLLLVAASGLYAVATNVPAIEIARNAAIVAIALLSFLFWSVYSRTRGPRLCKTSISEKGLHDVTPDSNMTFAWSQVNSIRMFRGDLYFRVGGAIVFVPGSAFASSEKADHFLARANELWQKNRQKQ